MKFKKQRMTKSIIEAAAQHRAEMFAGMAESENLLTNTNQ